MAKPGPEATCKYTDEFRSSVDAFVNSALVSCLVEMRRWTRGPGSGGRGGPSRRERCEPAPAGDRILPPGVRLARHDAALIMSRPGVGANCRK